MRRLGEIIGNALLLWLETTLAWFCGWAGIRLIESIFIWLTS